MQHRRLLVPLAVVPLAVGGLLTGTASAAPAAPAAASYSLEAAAPAAAAPVVGIVGGKWTMPTLTTKRTAGTAPCVASNASFVIKNFTKVVQPIKIDGKVFLRVPVGYKANICGRGKPFSETFVLARTGDKLTVRFN